MINNEMFYYIQYDNEAKGSYQWAKDSHNIMYIM
jgi:hypothetical protein